MGLRKGQIAKLLEIIGLIHVATTSTKSLPKCSNFEPNEEFIFLSLVILNYCPKRSYLTDQINI